MQNKTSKLFFLAILFLSIFFCGARVVFNVFADTTDITPPTLQSVAISPTAVSTGAYLTATLTVTDDSSGVAAVNIIFESPSGEHTLHAESTYVSTSSNWVYDVLVPSGSETGTWKVKSIYLADNAGNTTTLYYSNSVGSVFTVVTGTGTPQSSAITCASFTYGNWLSCQTTGTQFRAISGSLPAGCSGGTPILKQNCTYANQCSTSTATNEMNRNNCISSRGTWDSSTCTCICSTGYHFEGTSCVYTTAALPACAATDYTAWSTCNANGTQTKTLLSTAICTGSSVIYQSCTYVDTTTLPACAATDYTAWSTCSASGTQTRTLLTANSCTGSLPTSQTCTYTLPVCTTANYTDWSACQTTGKQTKTLLSTANCTGEKTLTQTCTYSYCDTTNSLLNTQNRTSCENSEGSWNSSTCVCTCSANHHLEGATCVYTNIVCTGFEYSDWSNCINGKQTRTITKKIPEGCASGFPDVLEKQCIVTTTCTKDTWIYGDWSDCVNGIQKRTATLSYDCPNVVTEKEKTEQACVSSVPTTSNYCTYTYSDWSDCVNGIKNRTILTRSPDGCKDTTTESLSMTCDLSSCAYTYSDWSACTNGKKTRTVISKYPTNCTGEDPFLEDSCTDSGDQVSSECIKIGWTNKSDCDIYTYREKIVAACKDKNLITFDSCREYIFNIYGKPSKCNSISGTACDSLIDNIILSSFKDVISTETKDQLSSVSGSAAVIDTQQGTITVQANATVPSSKEVKVEQMPLASSNADQVSVSLLSISNTTSQSSLSPVGIAFDADGDGLPDEFEKRLGTDPTKKDTDGDGVSDRDELKNGTNPLDPLSKTTTIVLSGVDKAIVDGKTLEQPKLVNSTVSDSLTVNAVETVKLNEKSNLKFQGKSKPNQLITLFVYSVMPIVVTVQADSNGNWIYELDKALVDGTHEAYVVINDDKGKIIESSLPTPFFIAQAQAVSVDNFVGADASQVVDKTNNMMVLYVFGGLVVMLIFIAGILIVRQRYS
jgi:hypothetical protein